MSAAESSILPSPVATVQKPPTWILIVLNVVFWVVYLAIVAFPTHVLEALVLLIGGAITVGISAVGQMFVWLAIRRRRPHWALRTALFFVPTAILVILPFVIPRPPQKPNQTQSSTSPSGKYVLTLPIEANPAYRNIEVWKVKISKPDGTVLYKDDASEFGGGFNVYWAWDDADRVWLYNSDDSWVYFWEFDGTKWTKTRWGYGPDKREIDRNIEQPEILYPYGDR
jgi:hypothetical protein